MTVSAAFCSDKGQRCDVLMARNEINMASGSISATILVEQCHLDRLYIYHYSIWDSLSLC